MVSVSSRKVLVAIDTSLKEPYISITQLGPLKTWVEVQNPSVDTLLYYSRKPGSFLIWLNNIVEKWRWQGGSPKAYLVSALLIIFLWPIRRLVPGYKIGSSFGSTVKQIQVMFPETLFAQRWKKLTVMQYFLKETSCEYLLLVTPSCYINKELLIDIISGCPRNTQTYSGSVQRNHDGQFVAGGALLVDRTAASDFLKNRFRIPTHTMDDVGLGILAANLGITPTQIPTLSVDTLGLNELKKAREHFYVRLKSGTEKNRLDWKLMQRLHKELEHA